MMNQEKSAYVKCDDDMELECHLVKNNHLIGVVFSYAHAKKLFDLIVDDFCNAKSPLHGKLVSDFKLYISGWGYVKNQEVRKDSKGEISYVLNYENLMFNRGTLVDIK